MRTFSIRFNCEIATLAKNSWFAKSPQQIANIDFDRMWFFVCINITNFPRSPKVHSNCFAPRHRKCSHHPFAACSSRLPSSNRMRFKIRGPCNGSTTHSAKTVSASFASDKRNSRRNWRPNSMRNIAANSSTIGCTRSCAGQCHSASSTKIGCWLNSINLHYFWSSGPLEALILAHPTAIASWRDLMGPTKVFKSIYSHPDCLRSRCGLTDTRNACHGSDSAASVEREIRILFPEFDVKEWYLKESERNAE